jgi:predicted nuclease of predicted toxin-antitoxin system
VEISLRFFLDQGVPRDTASMLRQSGLDFTHAGEIGMSKSEDTVIVEWARVQSAVIVTLDADFHAELAVSGAEKPSVIRLRLQGLDGAAVTKIVLHVLAIFGESLAEVCLVTVQQRKITCHKLPIARPDQP